MAAQSSNIQNYPTLTGDEFAEACHQLERRYCQATLGPVRRRWRLRTCAALNTSAFLLGNEYNTYIQIVRPLDGTTEDEDLLAKLDSLSFGDQGIGGGKGVDGEDEVMQDETPDTDGDRAMTEAEEADEGATLIREPKPKQAAAAPELGYVTYEIHLHPTYRVPALWFSLHGLPAYEPTFDFETVFRRLVPEPHKEVLRAAGHIGGISADHHPVTGVPSFFLHPCRIGDAMEAFACDKDTYLMVWLGLVGGCVGLWVPKEMALVPS